MIFAVLSFFLLRLLDFLVAYLAPRVIPYLGHFSHPITLTQWNLPHWIKAFANFDGIFYLRIAQQGYSQYEQAFFPLYPLLIKFLSPLFQDNLLITGLLVSNLSLLIGLAMFYKYLKLLGGKSGQGSRQRADRGSEAHGEHWREGNFWQDPIIWLLIFPTSFFFTALYTESLFFLLVILTFYFLQNKNYLAASIFAALSSATRFVGIFLFIPLLIYRVQRVRSKEQRYRLKIKDFLIVFSPFIGLLSYMFFLWKQYGDPLFFLSSQRAFAAGRSTELILFPQVIYRYIKIFLTISWGLQYAVSLLELLVFLSFLIILSLQLRDILRSKRKNISLLGLNLFSIANILIPTFTGTFLSEPRFALLSLSAFIYLGSSKNRVIRVSIASLFLFLHVVLLTLFIQGYFVS